MKLKILMLSERAKKKYCLNLLMENSRKCKLIRLQKKADKWLLGDRRRRGRGRRGD